MPSWDMMQKIAELVQGGYLVTLGAWVQINSMVTTRLNAFNTLSDQHLYAVLFDEKGDTVGGLWEGNLTAGRALRLDLRTLLPAGTDSFEGAIWIAARGADGTANLGIQAMDLDFIDLSRPEGHVLGTVHVMQDFFDTLDIPPFLDLLSPRVILGRDSDGADRWTNYLGMASFPIASVDPGAFEIRIANEAGDWLVADDLVSLPPFGSEFLSLNALFPDLHEHLGASGEDIGFGVLNVRETSEGKSIGLCAMLKVVSNETGDFMVDHLNDRHFAKPTQK